MEKNELIQTLTECLQRVYENDAMLMEIDIHEDAINNRLARYLSEFLESDLINVDAEYNRHMGQLKQYGLEGRSAIVDIVVHERETDDNNVAALECKKGAISKTDLSKIYALISPEFNYQYGVTIEYRSREVKFYQMVENQIEEEIIAI